jgi:hypothetical protein
MTGWDETESHPAEGTLLLYLDGELPPKEAALVQEHLMACWSCRMNADRVQEAVFSFVEYRDEVLRPLTIPPPLDEQNFVGRLRRLGDQLGKQSWLAQLYGLRSWFFSDARFAALPRQLIWTAPGLIVAFAALALFTWSDSAPVVTASELLQKASEAQAREIDVKNGPVIYQKLQVRRGQRTATWELWRDTANARFRQTVENAMGRSARGTDEAALLTELTEVLRANRMNPQQPLSAASFEIWRQSLPVKREDVSRTQTGAGETLTLRVLPVAEPAAGQITEASLVVRARDWRPLAQSLKVRDANEIREYELNETAYEVMPPAVLTVFTEPSPLSTATTATRTERLLAEASPTPSLKSLPTAAELQNAEIAALYALHQLKADLGEQIEVARESNERIVVRGQVETPDRKRELIAAMKEIPLVASRIQTFDEAAQTPRTQKPATVATSSESNDNDAPAAGVNQFEQRLARYFAERGDVAQQNTAAGARRIAQLANSVFTESSAALANSWALRRLADRFDESDDEQVDAAAAARLREIINHHLTAIGVRTRNLRSQLEPALVSIAGARVETAPAPQPADGTRKARVMRLFKAVEQAQRLGYRLFESGRFLSEAPEQAARLMLRELAELDAARLALEQDVRKQ